MNFQAGFGLIKSLEMVFETQKNGAYYFGDYYFDAVTAEFFGV